MHQQQHDNTPPGAEPRLLTTGEVAALYRVDGKTVCRWAREGKLSHYVTPGGHRRFFADEIFALIAERSTLRQVRS